MKNLISCILSLLFLMHAPFPDLWAHAPKLDLGSDADHSMGATEKKCQKRFFYPGSLVILPQDGRTVYFEAFAAAKKEIRIEICVLEDPLILQSLQQALKRGVRVRVIVDNGKYESTPDEQENLADLSDRKRRSVASQQPNISPQLSQSHPY